MCFLDSSSNSICIHQKCGNTNFSHKEKNKEWQEIGESAAVRCDCSVQSLNRGQLCHLHLPMHEHCSWHGRGEELWLSSAQEVQCLVPAFPFGNPGMLSAGHKVSLCLRAWNIFCLHPYFKWFFLHVVFVPMSVHYFPPSLHQHFSRGLMLPALYALIFSFYIPPWHMVLLSGLSSKWISFFLLFIQRLQYFFNLGYF